MTPKDELKDFTHVDLLHPSIYLKAADLRGKSVTVTIERISPQEELMMQGGRKDKKPVVYFVGKAKKMVLNKTNARAIAKAHGNETMEWIGAQIVLYPTMVEAKGEQVEAVRVDVEATRKLANKQPKQEREPGQEG